MKTKRTRFACAPPDKSKHRLGHQWRLQRVAAVAVMMMLIHVGSAQNLIINGTVNNTGKIRVKNQTVFAQSAIGGEIELKGADQTLPAKQYQSVRLSGTGTKTSSGGDFSIQKNLTIAAAVTLQIPKGNIITLGDTLFESGILKGAIQKSVNLTGSTTSSNFGNIGAIITWSSNAPGITSVIRASDSVQIGNGNQSMKRYYQIQPTDATATGTVVFKFDTSDLNGHDVNQLQLWRSTDNGNNWVRQIPVVDTLLKTITKSNVTLAGRWAMADTVRAIGPLQGAAGIPVIIAQASVQNNTQPIILTTLDTIKVLITDIFGTPVSNVQVKFAINLRPEQDSVGRLSDTTVVTDASGYAKTLFTVGSKVGQYRVIATALNLDTIKFYATAQNGAAKTLASIAVIQQVKPILTPLDTLFTITVADTGGNPVDSAQVQFAIVNPPVGSFGEALSVQTTTTDAFGRASTRLTLGSKADTFKVRAKVAGLTDSVLFKAYAKHGAPNLLTALAVSIQSKPILTQLDTAFTITVADTGGNPVDSALVHFAIVNRPVGSIGESLSVTTAYTNALGKASTILTLGNKLGQYHVSAKADGVKDTVTFKAAAKSGAASQIAALVMPQQSKPIFSQLDTAFTITVSDTGGNPVENALVHFRIASVPTGATDTALSVKNVPTDSLGRASTILTLGNRVGNYQVHATVNGLTDTAKFSAQATVGTPDQIATIGGTNQSGENGKPLADPFVVTIVDKGGNPVPNEEVEFKMLTVPSYGASLSRTTVLTDPLGQASTILTLGTRVQDYRVSATSKTLGSGQSLVIPATAVAGAAALLADVQGNNQSKSIGMMLDTNFVVRVLDANGNNVKGTTVTFTIDTIPNPSASGQSLTKFSDVSDDSGLASTQLTLGNKTGDYVVNARVNGIPIVSFRANAKPGAAVTFTQLAGINQTATIITPLQNDLVVRVIDIGGNSVENVPVQFSIESVPANATGQRLVVTSPVSDVNGLARATFTVGNKVGTYKIRARSAGIPDTIFTASATHGAAVAMIPSAGLNQTKPILTKLDIPFTIQVVDIGDNPVPKKNVQFTIIEKPAGDTSANLSITSDGTDSSGMVLTQLTLGSKVGTYRVKAFISTPLAEVREGDGDGIRKKSFTNAVLQAAMETTFTAQATHGAAAAFVNVMGDQQVNPTSTMLDTSFALTVRDIGGNAVPKAPVQFSITSAPLKATGQSLTDTLVTSDSLGNASTVFTLGDREGLYAVKASVAGSLSTVFTTSGYYVYGDPNNDVNVNIADMTTIIDQITGLRMLTEVDSIKSDLNKDGNIDTSDVNILRDNILNRSLASLSVPPFMPVPTVTKKPDGSPESPVAGKYFTGAKTEFEVTPQGLRLNMQNTVSVRGIELRIHLKDSTVNVSKANYVFSRAEKMNVVVRTSENEIRLLAYSLLNSEIQPGEGTILRIPKITSLSQIETTQVILSVASNTAVTPEATVVVSTPGKYPLTYKLEQNYPNPFNGSTIIEYDIPDTRIAESKIAIQIFNVLGQKVKTLINAPHDPGQYKVTWNGTDESGIQVASGIYFYRLISKNHLTTKKMIYVK